MSFERERAVVMPETGPTPSGVGVGPSSCTSPPGA
jgi:hypothetical protein